jgi:peroxiredoxin
MDPVILTGQAAPDFTLPDLDGRSHSLNSYQGKVVILNFWSAECPYARRASQEMNKFLKAWGNSVILLDVASNATEPPQMLQQAAKAQRLSLVLLDADHAVADLYGAATTPHVYVIDQVGILRYQGAFDDITFRQPTATQNYLRSAVEAVLKGLEPDPAQTPPYGCAIVRFQH